MLKEAARLPKMPIDDCFFTHYADLPRTTIFTAPGRYEYYAEKSPATSDYQQLSMAGLRRRRR